MNKAIFSLAAAAAASIATAGAVGPAAASTGAPVTIAVSHTDLNLSQAQDRRILEQRVENAARRVCRSQIGHSVLARASMRECRDEAVARAAEQLPFDDGMSD